MPKLRNTLEIDSVPPACTYAQVEARIVAAAGTDKFVQVYFNEDDGSYQNFRDSANINEGDQVASKATAFWSDSQGRLLIINAFPSLLQQFHATPFPKS